ncbi:homoserine dehydrogenase [bacterium BMS3Bbin06]|nr:homoserine dehydrogenase [bacterium BMS3Abin08]GBE33575.1 homoserine dehydrogenase [bacterium BMS3Bbin06]
MILNVGIIGFGTVGLGTARILIDNAGVIREKSGMDLNLLKIADLDIESDRGLSLKAGTLTTDVKEILENPDIHVVVELIGGIHPAKEFILEAIRKGKHVVTANKALLATEGEDIFKEAVERSVMVGFEASVAGGIPIIKVMREGLVANRIVSIYGIINGTSNYILTKMTDDGVDFDTALKEAQALGYAEADPSFDIEGIDSAHKLTLLASLAYGVPLSYDRIYVEGISRISSLDIEFAREFGYRIKLLAITKLLDGYVELRVHPTMIPADYMISKVDGVLNAVYVVGDAVGETLFYGRGAGDMPTGSAVVSDIVEIGKRIEGGCRSADGLDYIGKRKDLGIKSIGDIESMYYFRFSVLDRPGVLSKISGILGDGNISIASVIQKGRKAGETVPLVLLTHTARERDVLKAIKEIDALDVVSERTTFIRVEGDGIKN